VCVIRDRLVVLMPWIEHLAVLMPWIEHLFHFQYIHTVQWAGSQFGVTYFLLYIESVVSEMEMEV